MDNKYTVIFFLGGEPVDEKYYDDPLTAIREANNEIQPHITLDGSKVVYGATYVIIEPGDYKKA